MATHARLTLKVIAVGVILGSIFMLVFGRFYGFSVKNVAQMALPPNVAGQASALSVNRVEPIKVTPDMTAEMAEENFYRFLTRKHVDCGSSVSFGNKEVGAWDICIVPPFQPRKPCKVYSFGINFDWSFDDGISKAYNCVVQTFDPSMKMKDHRRSKLVWFYKTGIGGRNIVNEKGWKLRTLGTYLKKLSDDKSYIDYLKIDVEYSEWDSLKAIFQEDVLKNVKQLGIEIHTAELFDRRHTVTTSEQFAYYYRILADLEKQGFRRWYWHFNRFGKYKSSRTGKLRSCCYELVYINENFLSGQDGRPSWDAV